MIRLIDLLNLSIDRLTELGDSSPRLEAEILLSHLLKIPTLELYLKWDMPITESKQLKMEKLLKRKEQKEPWQYILGKVDFLDCSLKINRHVLIPRQETEILTHLILQTIESRPIEIWDIGTGSGCIGIALKKKRADCDLYLSDISRKALEVADWNARLNQVQVTLMEGDLLSPFQDRKADVIICNPPYISSRDFEQLPSEVRVWEPKEALVGGETGFEFYKRLAEILPSYLRSGGEVFFEIGNSMGTVVKEYFNSPTWFEATVLRDWSNHDRFMRIKSHQRF